MAGFLIFYYGLLLDVRLYLLVVLVCSCLISVGCVFSCADLPFVYFWSIVSLSPFFKLSFIVESEVLYIFGVSSLSDT